MSESRELNSWSFFRRSFVDGAGDLDPGPARLLASCLYWRLWAFITVYIVGMVFISLTRLLPEYGGGFIVGIVGMWLLYEDFGPSLPGDSDD